MTIAPLPLTVPARLQALEVGGAGIDAAATIARQIRWMVAALMTGV
jgi:hypothetical protein